MTWELTKGLKNLQNQINTRWPNRDKTTDGTIGDPEHQSGTSDHNPDDSEYDNAGWDGDSDNKSEVRAYDQDKDLREEGTTAQMLVDHIRKLPNLGTVLRYMIYNKKMYHVDDDFNPTTYTGTSNPHTEHIHYSGARTDAADNNTTFNYRLDEVGDVALTDSDIQKIADKLGKDLNTQASGISQGMRKNTHWAIDEIHPYTGNPGERITAAGWGSLTPWLLLQYLFEMIATADKAITGPDGTVTEVSGSVIGRLDRMEDTLPPLTATAVIEALTEVTQDVTALVTVLTSVCTPAQLAEIKSRL
jgi:hypothetical protein